MPSPFPADDFLLESDFASELYTRFARDLPIVDYHTHLPPEQMAEDHRFRSMTELWLDGDHYKWRAMRANGIPERLCSEGGEDFERFSAWARTVPETLFNPLYHWTHMELRRPFGVELKLQEETARAVYDRCNERLKEDGFTAMGLLETFKVAVVCTTDDPVSTLEAHERLARRTEQKTRVYPTWRPDRALEVSDSKAWNLWVEALEGVSGHSVSSLETFLEALDSRHAAFQAMGCRASDHGLESFPLEETAPLGELFGSFERLRRGQSLSRGESMGLKSFLLERLAQMDHERSFVQQFHLGALRNVSTRLLTSLGPNVGGDAIGDFSIAVPLARFLDALDQKGTLAKTILYNLNPRDNELMAAMAGTFQGDSVPGKVQYGPAWWFLDQKDGIEAQLRALANMGLLSRFVGMTTDSRSFLSYSRHDYFRRILCNFVGEGVKKGLVPKDVDLLGSLVSRVSFLNARDYFSFSLGTLSLPTAT